MSGEGIGEVGSEECNDMDYPQLGNSQLGVMGMASPAWHFSDAEWMKILGRGEHGEVLSNLMHENFHD